MMFFKNLTGYHSKLLNGLVWHHVNGKVDEPPWLIPNANPFALTTCFRYIPSHLDVVDSAGIPPLSHHFFSFTESFLSIFTHAIVSPTLKKNRGGKKNQEMVPNQRSLKQNFPLPFIAKTLKNLVYNQSLNSPFPFSVECTPSWLSAPQLYQNCSCSVQ